MARTRRKTVSRWDDSPKPVYRRPKPRVQPKPVSIRQLDYRAYCKSPHWLGLRERLFAERGGCEICNSFTNRTLHHLRYTRNGESILWNEQDSDLVVLCWKCHQAWEAYCKGERCNAEIRGRIRGLMSLGLDRDGAFPASVAPNYQEILTRYQEDHRRSVEERQRKAWLLRFCLDLLRICQPTTDTSSTPVQHRQLLT